jgi:hypothetical protein
MNLTIYSSISQAHVSPDATLIRADANPRWCERGGEGES